MGDIRNIVEDDMAADSKEPPREGTPSSIESTPEAEADIGAEPSQEPLQPQKRKGGRKPVRSDYYCIPFDDR